jgi:hypothetical protein
MTPHHPITPPPEMVEQWAHLPADWNTAASLIAQWGADQELEACCEWLKLEGHEHEHEALHAARRPKPPSLKGRVAAEIENGTACDRESDRITRDVILEVAAWIDRLGYHSCATELKNEINQ